MTRVNAIEHMDVGLSASAPFSAQLNIQFAAARTETHIHRAFEFGLVLSGHFTWHTENTPLDYQAGDIWFCHPWEPHGQRESGSASESLFIAILFLPEFLLSVPFHEISWLSMFAAPIHDRPQVVSSQIRDQVLGIGQELQKEIEEKRPQWLTVAAANLFRLLVLLGRDWQPPVLAQPQAKITVNDLNRIMPTLELQADPSRLVKLTEAASLCNMTPTWFNTVFQRTMGLSFPKYHLRARVAHAAHQLLATEKAVEDIAAETGFIDASHLHRCFVKYYTCTPAQYRNRMKYQRPNHE